MIRSASFAPCPGCGISASAMSQDGCPLLHSEGEGSLGETGAQEDSHGSVSHRSQKVSTAFPWQESGGGAY